MKLIQIIYITLYLILSCILISCDEKKCELKEKNIAQEVAKYLIIEDSIALKKYSGDNFLHITSQKINDNYFKTFVTLNGLKPTKSMNEEIDIKGFKTFIYYSSSTNLNYPDVFFVPDAEYWDFLVEVKNEEIVLNKIERVHSNIKYEIDESDFDF